VLTDIEITINRLIEQDSMEGFEAYTPKKPVDAPPPPPPKPVFGRSVKKYSSRL
jgi:hypothetical protein